MKSWVKRCVLLIAIVAILFGMYCTAWAAEEITVYVDGEIVEFDIDPRIIAGRTMVPIRAIFEALGAEVEWYDETKTAIAVREGYRISLSMNDKLILIGDSDFLEMDVVPVNIDGRILVPARFAGEAFACEVDWIEATRTVTICSKEYLENMAA